MVCSTNHHQIGSDWDAALRIHDYSKLPITAIIGLEIMPAPPQTTTVSVQAWSKIREMCSALRAEVKRYNIRRCGLQGEERFVISY